MISATLYNILKSALGSPENVDEMVEEFGGGQWKEPAADFASLPTEDNDDGDARAVLDTQHIYVWHEGSTTWVNSGLSAGINSLNSLAVADQILVAGTAGTDFEVSSSGDTHTFNLPDASDVARGVVSTGSQVFAGSKTFENTPEFATGKIIASLDANSVIGDSTAGSAITSGTDNIMIGEGAGATVTTGSNNILIGSAVDASAPSADGELAIGDFITGDADTVRIDGSRDLRVEGNLGVGNSAAGTTPGTVVKKIEVFDAAGVSLGFIAVYDAIV